MVKFERLDTISYSPSVVTMAVSWEILVENRWNIAMPFGSQKLDWCGYPTVEKVCGYV